MVINKKEVRERDPEVVWKKERGRWNEDYGNRTSHSFISSFIWRLLFSAVLFGLIIGIYRSQQAWAVSIQHYIAQSLNREMDFQAVESWYVAHFGEAPTIIPIFKESQDAPQKVIASQTLIAPIHGKVTTPFSAELRGIEISPNQDSNATQQVKSVATGRVIEVLNETMSGKRITIQHTGGLAAVYGHLDTALKVNDWVEAGEHLGWLSNAHSVQPQTLYFAMKQGENYIDPLDVMSFD